jgi:hypothetical protein
MPRADSNSSTPKVALPRAAPPAARKKVERAIEDHLAAVEATTTFLGSGPIKSLAELTRD